MGSLAFGQTTAEQVTVTGTNVGSERGSAASYQPANSLVVLTHNAKPERFELYGTGLVSDKTGRAVTTPIKPDTPVRVFYTRAGPTRIVDHIVVEG
jgi:hypothetical protein